MADKSFKNLIVWQRAKNLAIEVYKLTDSFPKYEIFGLSDQMRRAVISISSNIAEGYTRRHVAERLQFLHIAYGSGAELESQMEIAKAPYPELDYQEGEALLSEIMKMLNVLVHKISLEEASKRKS